MSEQIFISYRRSGGDVSAKLVCEALKNRGYTVFYDFDSLHGGYFDTRIIDAIEGCDDFVLVLPKNGLDRCQNADDWVRLEVVTALKSNKNIVPIMLEGFEFPKELPEDISVLSRINAVPFSMPFFDAMVDMIVDRLRARPIDFHTNAGKNEVNTQKNNFSFTKNADGYSVSYVGDDVESVVIPGEHLGKPVTEISDEAFRDRKKLSKVTIPDTVVRIGERAFGGCSALGSLTLPESVKIIDKYAFQYCTRLISVTFCEGIERIESSAFSYSGLRGNLKLPGSLREIGPFAFSSTPISGIEIAEGLERTGIFVFSDCQKLAFVILPDSLTEISSRAFSGCSELCNVQLGKKVKRIESGAFEKCQKLRSVLIPKTVKKIDEKAFSGCYPFIRISYPGNKNEWKTVVKKNAFPPFTRYDHF